MPRQTRGNFRSEVILPLEKPGIVASARNFTTQPLNATSRFSAVKNEQWQKAAWEFYDTVAEFHYIVTLVANMLSAAKLIITKDGAPNTDPTPVGVLNEFGGGPDNQPEMLRQYAIHFTVAGDSYTIARNATDDWFVAAASEIRVDADGTWTVGTEQLAPGDLVIRAWRAHPQKRMLPDSPTRAVLPILAEIDGYTKHASAQIDSRLASAGILIIPEEANIGKAPRPIVTTGFVPDVEDVVELPDVDAASQLVMEIMEVASASLTDPSSAAAKVPIVIQMKGDAVANVKYMTFWTQLDAALKDLREDAITRLSRGMDMPPEKMMGTAKTNHWGAFAVDESAIKSHAEPLLYAICDALTDGYLRPALVGGGMDAADAAHYAIGADTSDMRLGPDRSQQALELNDRGIIGAAAVIRENGFQIEDAMSDDEKRIWLLQKVASGSTTPELVAEALMAFKVPGITPQPAGNTQVVQEARPIPSLEDHPYQGPPDPDDSEAMAAQLVAPAFMMVDRALERAGNRLRNQMTGVRVKTEDGKDVPAVDTYRYVSADFAAGRLDYLLEDAWSSVDRYSTVFPVDKAWFRNALDTYTRELIQFGRKNDVQALRQHLAFTLKTRPERVSK